MEKRIKETIFRGVGLEGKVGGTRNQPGGPVRVGE